MTEASEKLFDPARYLRLRFPCPRDEGCGARDRTPN